MMPQHRLPTRCKRCGTVFYKEASPHPYLCPMCFQVVSMEREQAMRMEQERELRRKDEFGNFLRGYTYGQGGRQNIFAIRKYGGGSGGRKRRRR